MQSVANHLNTKIRFSGECLGNARPYTSFTQNKLLRLGWGCFASLSILAELTSTIYFRRCSIASNGKPFNCKEGTLIRFLQIRPEEFLKSEIMKKVFDQNGQYNGF